MLTISKPLSAGKAQTYHAKEFTAPEQNYWNKGAAIQGKWHGKISQHLRPGGAVGAREFAHLTEGQDPHTGKQLVRHRAVQQYQTASGETVAPVEHRAGWDATFSAPKSVSLTALVGGDDRVRKPIAMRSMSPSTSSNAIPRRGSAATIPPRPLAASLRPSSSTTLLARSTATRLPAAHAYRHFQHHQREDGSSRALQPRALFESQQFATAIYQAQLTHQLRNLGYEIEAGRSGAPEIKGYSREYLDASSPRRQQIVEALARSGREGRGGLRDRRPRHP